MKLIADGTFGTFFSAMATMYSSAVARNLFITYESIIHAMFGCRKVNRMRKRKRLNENGPYLTLKFLINEMRRYDTFRNTSNN